MKPQNRTLVIVLTLSLGGAVAGHFLRQGYETVQVQPIFEQEVALEVREAAEERVWRPTPARHVFNVEGQGEGRLLKPGLLRLDAAENLYVLDHGDLLVKKYSPQAELLQLFGWGRGRAPGELLNPTDFAVSSTGEIWICDPIQSGISIFTPEGDFVQRVPLSVRPYRLALDPRGGFTVLGEASGDALFQVYDSDFLKVNEFGRFVEHQSRNLLAVEGWLAPMSSGGFVYAPVWLGVLASYDAEGEVRSVTRTFGFQEVPRVLVDRRGYRRIDPRAPRLVQGVTTWNDNVHLFAATAEAGRRRAVIDVFSADGRYLHSMRLPAKAKSAHLTDRFIYLVEETTVSKWSLGPWGPETKTNV